uniref:trypsin n=1 Tax=Mamestra configurata TaxID=174822 RepID=E7D004_9NEOP|nr:serine protease 52 [Mamestra configurata]
MRVIILFALFIAAVAAVPANPERIVGGSVTTIGQYPTMAACLYSGNLVNYWQSCGGTILNNRSILTAAHCTIGHAANRWRFRVGSSWANSGGVVHSVSQIINHPSYNGNTYNNDIAILRSATTIAFNNNVRAVSIAGSNYNLADNQVVWAAGWGLTSEGGSPSEQLRHVQIYSINQATCRSRYPSLTDNMLCSGVLNVGGRDQCTQDSGGPLYHNGVQVGVCSFGTGCARPQFPGVNARVSRFASWIASNA